MDKIKIIAEAYHDRLYMSSSSVIELTEKQENAIRILESISTIRATYPPNYIADCYKKVVRVIESCENLYQLPAARKMVENFENLFGSKYIDMLYVYYSNKVNDLAK